MGRRVNGGLLCLSMECVGGCGYGWREGCVWYTHSCYAMENAGFMALVRLTAIHCGDHRAPRQPDVECVDSRDSPFHATLVRHNRISTGDYRSGAEGQPTCRVLAQPLLHRELTSGYVWIAASDSFAAVREARRQVYAQIAVCVEVYRLFEQL